MEEDKDIQKILGSVILHKVDAEKGEGPELAKAHGVGGYPTFIMANADVQPINRWMGYSKDDFTDVMSVTMADLTTIDEKRARYASHPTAKDAVTLAGYDGATGEHARAVTFYRSAEGFDRDADYSYEIFDATFDGYRKKVFPKTELEATAVRALENADDSETLSIAGMMSYIGSREEDHAMQVKYIKAGVEGTANSTDETVVEKRQRYLPDYALWVEDNPSKAVDLKKASMDDGWMDSTEGLNTYAWWAFERKVDLQNALAYAKKGVELAEPGKEKAMILDTAAEICNALNNCSESVDMMKLAMAEDPDSEYYAKQLNRFEEILASQSN